MLHLYVGNMLYDVNWKPCSVRSECFRDFEEKFDMCEDEFKIADECE